MILRKHKQSHVLQLLEAGSWTGNIVAFTQTTALELRIPRGLLQVRGPLTSNLLSMYIILNLI